MAPPRRWLDVSSLQVRLDPMIALFSQPPARRRAFAVSAVAGVALGGAASWGCSGPAERSDAPRVEQTVAREVVVQAGGRSLETALWQGLPVRYDLHADPTLGQVIVRATFRSAPAPLPLRMPSRSQQGALRDIRARCKGETLTIESGAKRTLSIRHDDCAEIELTYQVSTGSHTSPAARLDRDLFLVRGPQTLILPDLPPEQMATMGAFAVAVHAPRRWTVATNWTPVQIESGGLEPVSDGRMTWHYIADDVGHLQDSVVVAGALDIWSSELPDGRTLQVATGPGLSVSRDTLKELVERTVLAQRDYLPEGWVWPRGTGRLSMVVMGSPHPDQISGGGHRGGFVIEAGEAVTQVDLAELIAHETFHVLNGHLLVHSPDQEYQTLWFKEGVTSYVAARTVVRAGLADAAWFRRRMASLSAKYYGNPLAMKLDSEHLERRYWRDPHARRLPYDKGALIGLILDAQLSGAGNSSGLAAMISELLRGALDGHPYGADTLRAAVESSPTRSPDFDVNAFWGRFVDGVEPLPLDSALAKLDLHLVRTPEVAPYFGIQVGSDDWGPFIADVDPQSSGARAGLKVGDRLVADPCLEKMTTLTPATLTVVRGGAATSVVLQPERGSREAYRLHPLENKGAPRYLQLLAPAPGGDGSDTTQAPRHGHSAG